jgi:MFS family permease
MKKWALLVVIGYILTLVILTFPVLFVVNNVAHPRAPLDEIFNIALEPGSGWGWIYLVPFLLSLAFVLIPIGPAPRRWKGRRPVFWSILVISLACAVLLMAAGLSVYYGLPEAWRPGEMISSQPAIEKIVDQDAFWIAMPIVVVVLYCLGLPHSGAPSHRVLRRNLHPVWFGHRIFHGRSGVWSWRVGSHANQETKTEAARGR